LILQHDDRCPRVAGAISIVVRNLTDKPRRLSDNSFRIVDEEGLVVLPGPAVVNVLNRVGTRVFALIDGKRTVEEIVQQITDEFDVPHDQALVDVDIYLSELVQAGMVAPADENPEGAVS